MRSGFGFASPVTSVLRAALGLRRPRLPARFGGSRFEDGIDGHFERSMFSAAKSFEGLAVLEAAARKTGLAGVAPGAERARIPARGALVIAVENALSARMLIALGDSIGATRRDVRLWPDRAQPWWQALEALCLDGENDEACADAARAWLGAGGALIASLGVLVRAQSSSPDRARPRSGDGLVPAGEERHRTPLGEALALGAKISPSALTPLPVRRIWGQPAACLSLPAALVFGDPIDAGRFDGLASENQRTRFLRLRFERLGRRASALSTPLANRPPAPHRVLAPIVARGDQGWMEAEIAALSPAERIVPHERFVVAAVRAPRIPALLREIGRLREITFRAVGEGSGNAVDLDAFDRSYTHLLVWDRAAGALAGAYRLAATDEQLPVFGARGLYTSTLFDCAPGFFTAIGPAIELGRSFVGTEYQRSSVTLSLLWKGIGRFVVSRPGARVLFGAVSISGRYTTESRSLLARALSQTRGDDSLARFVAPRRPLRDGNRNRRRFDDLASLDRLSLIVADGEADAAETPVLVREYAKLGGRFVSWSVDPSFGGTLDGLVVVDLARTDRRLLAHWLGREHAAAFLARTANAR